MTTNENLFASTIEQTRALRDGTASKKKLTSSKTPQKKKRTRMTSAQNCYSACKRESLDPVEDQVIAVVDPELSTEDMESDIAELQDIISDAEEGEVPVVNDYVGKDVYQCSVCGNNFFSDEDILENPITCPVCGEQSVVVLQGEVDEANTDDDFDDEVSLDEDEIPDDTTDDTTNEDDYIVVDDTTEEYPADDEVGLVEESCRKKSMKSNYAPRYSKYSFDDARMNALLKNYVTENYKGVRSLRVVSGAINPNSGKLVLKCNLITTKGKSKTVILMTEGINLRSRSIRTRMTESSKVFTKNARYSQAPFTLKARIQNNTIIPTEFSYNYMITEGLNTYKVSGSPRILG